MLVAMRALARPFLVALSALGFFTANFATAHNVATSQETVKNATANSASVANPAENNEMVHSDAEALTETDEAELAATAELSQFVAAGFAHSLLLKLDGSAWAMGSGGMGQLGTGDTDDHPSPVCVVSKNVKTVAAGNYHSLFLLQNGTLLTAGLNRRGAVGVGDKSVSAQLIPRAVMDNVVSVAAGDWHTLVLLENGTALAAGDNEYGQLGAGSSEEKFHFVPVIHGVRHMAAGGSSSFFVTKDGALHVAGSNACGQLGDGTTEHRHTPKRVYQGVKAVFAGSCHALFLLEDDTLRACGENTFGQLGDGTTLSRHTLAVSLNGERVSQATAGFGQSFFFLTNGGLYASGNNGFGQLGTGNDTFDGVALHVMDGVVAIGAGARHTLFVSHNGSVYGAGQDLGQFEDTSDDDHVRLYPLGINLTKVEHLDERLSLPLAGEMIYTGSPGPLAGVHDIAKKFLALAKTHPAKTIAAVGAGALLFPALCCGFCSCCRFSMSSEPAGETRALLAPAGEAPSSNADAALPSVSP